jgi:hypothetical protein
MCSKHTDFAFLFLTHKELKPYYLQKTTKGLDSEPRNVKMHENIPPVMPSLR